MLLRTTFLAVLLLGSTLLAQSPANRFGFSGPEIFPIDPGIGQLRAADLDGDGRVDLVLVNNARSKITLLYNQTGKTNRTASAVVTKKQINELPPDSRFRIETVAAEKRISSLVVADLNGDGKPDLAYYGEPRELVIQYNVDGDTFSNVKRIPIDDGTLDPYALVTGDLNGDGRPDLVLLGETQIYFIPQLADHTLGEPEKWPYVGVVKSLQVLDIQGDGRDDLMLVNWDNANPFRFRLQNASGQLDPEIHFALPPIRSYWADDLDGDHRTEIVTILQRSGRAQVANFVRKPSEPILRDWVAGQLSVLPLTRTGKTRRGMSWADFNGDGREDLIVAEPESGQLRVFLQQADGSVRPAGSFSTLTGISEVAVGKWSNTKTADVFVLSNDERQVAVTTPDPEGRLAFPKTIPLGGRPLTMAVGLVSTDAPPVLAVVVERETGPRELQLRKPDGTAVIQKLSESFKANPTSMVWHDVDQDGRPDLVLLSPYEKIKILRQGSTNNWEEIDVSPPGGSSEQPWLCLADVDGDGHNEMLLPQKSFLRAVTLQMDVKAEGTNKASWSFVVREQINGASSNSRLVAATPMTAPGDKTPVLCLLDAERKVLTVAQRDGVGTWKIQKNLSLPVTEFSSAEAVATGTSAPLISFLGLNAVGLMSLQGDSWDFQELDGYETPIKDGLLHDVISGDLNNDGRKDLVFIESSKGYLDLVTFAKPHNLIPANRWQVFEERTFRNRRNEFTEPREAAIADVTGDGKNDLIVIVHDRVLVYPQE